MKLIVGLGNPGGEYAETRHNLGFMVIDLLHAQAAFPRFKTECHSLVSKAELEGVAVGIVKPQTFMNLSGQAVAALVEKYQLPHEDLLIVSDDTALPFGRIRLRRKGTHGGHNGLRSIIAALGDLNFPRLRLGVCPTDRTISDMPRFVLSPFTKLERKALDDLLMRSAEAARSVVRAGIERTMVAYN